MNSSVEINAIDSFNFHFHIGTITIARIGGGDQAVPGDYDGDNKTDIAIFRPSAGQWWINRSTAGVIAMQTELSVQQVQDEQRRRASPHPGKPS